MTKYPARKLVLSQGDLVFSPIGQVTALPEAGSARSLIDASSYGDDWMDYVVGQQDGDELAITIAYDPADDGHQDLVDLYDAGTSDHFHMEDEESGFHVKFPALVTKLSRGGAIGGLLQMSVSLKILNPGVQDVSESD